MLKRMRGSQNKNGTKRISCAKIISGARRLGCSVRLRGAARLSGVLLSVRVQKVSGAEVLSI